MHDCVEAGVKVSIQLDLSAAMYSVGDPVPLAVVEGDQCLYLDEAERSAVLKCFKYLEKKHLTRVLDFSSRVAHGLDENDTYGYVNEAIYSLGKVIEQWESSMKKCEMFVLDFEAKIVWEKLNGVLSDKGKVYELLIESMEILINIYACKLSTSRSSMNHLEYTRKKYHTKSTEKGLANIRKVM